MIRLALIVALLAGPAIAAGSAEPAEEENLAEAATGLAPIPYSLEPPEQVNAFPPEILARMREALVALEAARGGQ